MLETETICIIYLRYVPIGPLDFVLLTYFCLIARKRDLYRSGARHYGINGAKWFTVSCHGPSYKSLIRHHALSWISMTPAVVSTRTSFGQSRTDCCINHIFCTRQMVICNIKTCLTPHLSRTVVPYTTEEYHINNTTNIASYLQHIP